MYSPVTAGETDGILPPVAKCRNKNDHVIIVIETMRHVRQTWPDNIYLFFFLSPLSLQRAKPAANVVKIHENTVKRPDPLIYAPESGEKQTNKFIII